MERVVERIIYIDLNLKLSDIPEPGSCFYCQAPTQRELLDYETSHGNLRVEATPTPGYGCIGCGLKTFPRGIAPRLLEEAAKVFLLAGDKFYSDNLRSQARDLLKPEFLPAQE